MTENTRDTKWDNIKAVLIFTVVIGHIADLYTGESALARALYFYIYLFHMPLFIFISGLFGKKYVRERQYGKISFFFFLYFIIKMLNNLPNMLLGKPIRFSMWTEGGTPWYCLALFVFYLVTIAADRLPRAFVLAFSILLACFSGYDSDVDTFFAQSRIIVFYPFFFLGYMLDAEEVKKRLSSRRTRVCGALLLIAVGVFLLFFGERVYWIRGFLTGKNPFSHWEGWKEAYGGIIRLLCYAASILTGMAVIAVVPKNMGKLAATVGRRSLEVYALHPAVFRTMYGLGLQSLMRAVWPAHPNLLVFPVAALVTLICSWGGFEKIFARLRRCFSYAADDRLE